MPNEDCCTLRDRQQDGLCRYDAKFETCNSALLEQLTIGSLYLAIYIVYVAVAQLWLLGRSWKRHIMCVWIDGMARRVHGRNWFTQVDNFL